MDQSSGFPGLKLSLNDDPLHAQPCIHQSRSLSISLQILPALSNHNRFHVLAQELWQFHERTRFFPRIVHVQTDLKAIFYLKDFPFKGSEFGKEIRDLQRN